MKRIGYLNILGEKWSVFSSDEMPENVEGLTTFKVRTIQIRSDLKGHEYEVCLIHEVGHAVLYELGIYLTGLLSTEIEELLVDAYAKAIVKNKKELAKIVKAGK